LIIKDLLKNADFESEIMTDNNDKVPSEYICVGEGSHARQIAVCHRGGNTSRQGAQGFVWLGGYRSDMEGSKAIAIDDHAAKLDLACTRHDYSGHGQSGGEFVDGTISRWLEESLEVFQKFTEGPQILVGSSMGGWIALRMVQELQKLGEADRVHGLLLLAPAPDFTKELYEPKLTDDEKAALESQGYFEVPTPYGPDPNIFTKKLFDDGAQNLVMKGILQLGAQIHIIQGMEDPDVPWQHAMCLMEHLSADDVTITLIRDGDHRLSREKDIVKILQSLDGMLE
jgi:pimeloyl-ACP methyl ester carboxylesterase